MTSKFAVALIATTMFVAPALAADAVNSNAATGAANTTAPATPAPQSVSKPASSSASNTTTSATAAAGKQAAETTNKGKKIATAHHRVHRTMTAHNDKSRAKTVSVTRSVKVVKSAPQAWPFGPLTWTAPEKTASTVKVVHHHPHHVTLAHNGKPTKAVKTEAKTVGTAPVNAPAAAASTAGKTDGNKADVKVIKADKDLKNGVKPGKDSKTTTGQSVQGASAPTGKTNKDSGKVN